MSSRLWKRLTEDRGAQILELAVALPLLVVFVVGIYDFSQAFNTKEKLNFAARDGARLGSTQPTNDLSQSTPLSVVAIRDLVDADLLAAGINDCGLGSIIQTGTLIWTATGACPNSSTFTLTIDRGFVVPAAATASQPVQQISTHVDLQYPYKWQFSGAIRLVVPSATYAGVTVIETDALAANQD
jgi:Flp pilus assembly protein TadG